MTKYIDADEVLKLAEKGILVSNGNYKIVVKAISEIPAADVVSVIRCKDCANAVDLGRVCYCSELETHVNWDVFCSFAERREE